MASSLLTPPTAVEVGIELRRKEEDAATFAWRQSALISTRSRTLSAVTAGVDCKSRTSAEGLGRA